MRYKGRFLYSRTERAGMPMRWLSYVSVLTQALFLPGYLSGLQVSELLALDSNGPLSSTPMVRYYFAAELALQPQNSFTRCENLSTFQKLHCVVLHRLIMICTGVFSQTFQPCSPQAIAHALIPISQSPLLACVY